MSREVGELLEKAMKAPTVQQEALVSSCYQVCRHSVRCCPQKIDLPMRIYTVAFSNEGQVMRHARYFGSPLGLMYFLSVVSGPE
jgi:hypothetical protein